MKKIIFVVCLLAVVMSFGVVACAESFSNTGWGMAFEIPEGFKVSYVTDTDSGKTMQLLTEDNRACVNLGYAENVWGYFEGSITEEEFNMLLDEECATEYLTGMMAGGNVNFKSKNVYNKTLNGTKYYFFDGKYVLRAEEFEAEDFSVIAVTWAKNGKVYVLSYIRFEDGKVFDVEAFLANIDYSSGDIKIYVNEERVKSDTPPAATEGRILVPIRAVAEAMGYTVEWDGESQRVTLVPENEEDSTVVFTIGSPVYQVDDEDKELDVEALAVNGRTYIPLRAATEAMGAIVTWDATSNSAMIMY